jgi:hypothetical protein
VSVPLPPVPASPAARTCVCFSTAPRCFFTCATYACDFEPV